MEFQHVAEFDPGKIHIEKKNQGKIQRIGRQLEILKIIFNSFIKHQSTAVEAEALILRPLM